MEGPMTMMWLEWGQNRDNPAVAGRQECVPKKQKN